MKVIVKTIDKINKKIALSCKYFTFLLVSLLVYEVFMRYVLGSPTQWSYDATYFTSSLFLMLGMAYTFQIDEHVSVNILSRFFPKRVKAFIFVVFMIVFFFLCWGNIILQMHSNVIMSWKIKETSMTGMMPPIYPFKTWIYIGVWMLFIQGISEFLKNIYILVTGKEMFETGEDSQ